MPTRVPLTAQMGVQPGRRVLDGGHDVYRLEGTSRPATIKRRVFRVNFGSLNTVADHNVSLQIPDHCQGSPPTSGSLHQCRPPLRVRDAAARKAVYRVFDQLPRVVKRRTDPSLGRHGEINNPSSEPQMADNERDFRRLVPFGLVPFGTVRPAISATSAEAINYVCPTLPRRYIPGNADGCDNACRPVRRTTRPAR
jgi:hypothetical protein